MYNSRANLRKYYVDQYGLENANKVRQLEYLKTKRSRLITSLNFLKRCRDTNIIPVCVKISPKKDILGSGGILRQASKRLLCRLIQQHRTDSYKIDQIIDIQNKEIQQILSKTDWQVCNDMLNKRALTTFNNFKQKQIQKYNKLYDRQFKDHNCITDCPNDQTSKLSLVNLSKQQLDKNTIEVLNKGLNFAPAPSNIPYEEIICKVEECLYKNQVVKEDSEAIRQDVSCVLRRCKPPKQNLSRAEFLALKNLRSNTELTVLRADKGNATVVMDTSDYNAKISEILSDEKTYKNVKQDPTNKILKKTSEIIAKHQNKLNLDAKNLIPSCVKPPKLYGLPKIHKENVPLRPIVSQIDTPTYKLAQYLSKILAPLRGHTPSHVRDSYQFVGEVKKLMLTNNETMVSFDVQSLFTKLPVQDCIEIIKRKLKDNNMAVEYADLLEHCLTSGYLLWNHSFYVQIDGIAMGSPVSPVVADIFMEDFEERALCSPPAMPKIFKRYVDDTFTIIPKHAISAFLKHLNSVNTNIQFTMELETDDTLAFLDLLLIRNPDNTISHTVFRKPTHTDRYLNGESHHHPSQLATVGKSLFQRAHHLCDADHLEGELRHIKQVLRNNKLQAPRQRRRHQTKPPTVERQPAFLPYVKGVTDRIGNILKRASIKTVFKPHKKVNQFLRPIKCNIPLQEAGVYKIDCECGLSYIGQTKRNIATRLKEHIADVKNRRITKSAVCEHALDKPNHFIRFDKPKVLARESRTIPRMIREAIEIKKHPNFNKDDGWSLSTTWEPIIQQLKSQVPQTAKPQDTISSFCRNPSQYARQLRNRWR